MKAYRVILIVLGCLIVTAVGFTVVWINLPVSVKYAGEIRSGNSLAAEIEAYKLKNDVLPESNDWEVQESWGIPEKNLGWKPAYEKIDENSFLLIYSEGFDGPYLTYESKTKTWALK